MGSEWDRKVWMNMGNLKIQPNQESNVFLSCQGKNFEFVLFFSMLSTYPSWMRQRVATKTSQQECEWFVIDVMENEQNQELRILNVLLVKELER